MKYMYQNMRDLELACSKCEKCPLYKTRRYVVFGEGNIHADIMFIGVGPGGDEDRTGVPFVGKAGKLLDMVFSEVGIKREDVYIGNVVKCRPPMNRNPEAHDQSSSFAG